ncbi:aldo/keto reductase [Roseobacter sp. YSTF-M11]|uniref:Aldo/keto reductase n=1 Tax=Roseobacter insulae TaxID=2859783 RepID=A0A9X1FU53_9RHOB|nr:aldo/keto reductase [Roseobacter insulae]MBW4707447.1 aldo/keto reductase [Roseobacter insulae]
MKQRQIRQDGKLVSEIGLGCWSFGGSYGPTTEKEAHRTLAAALDLGVDFLDTANVYGMGVSEKIIGSFLKGDTSRFTIATKAAIWRDPDTGKRGFNNKADYLRDELEKSLTRLGTDHVDLYYIHRRDQEVEVEDLMETLLGLKAEGKIGGIGFSEISPATLRRAVAVGSVDAVQSEYSLWTRQPELGMIQTCAELGVAFVPFSPLGRGVFAPVPPDPATFEDGHFRKGTPRFSEPNFTYNLQKISEFKALAADLNVSPITLAVAWCLAGGPHLIPIPGTRTAGHLAECAAGSAFPMTSEIMGKIEGVLPVGWAHGDRYTHDQWVGVEGYC